MNKRKSKRGNFEIEDLGDVELPSDLEEKIELMTKTADAELEATRVNFRWQIEPLNVVKTVAEAMGVPYQTYIKQVLYKQALEDLSKIQRTLPSKRKTVRAEKFTAGAQPRNVEKAKK